ncbi:hypothetical protein IW492_05285 [Enterococcus sp. BWB1-3]|uniref:hypothetical protein n=1 Tax=unclassified Enterococcus TaxID=2608891 RepID=UPI00192133C5|nr:MULTISPECIES: hypothetical protein [unclassified Enterococcus]MBL1228646.1 hypothetical protein [Enterococcus sp. BWB1-3]MCB5952717.1 hypothetical protein [Enterococcus sp. BWT-B8]MCB5953633.1 hypothetical protein [Enterococcus sp. CWB-B31]
MKLVVTERHLGEGVFPTFSEGTIVTNLTLCEHYHNWTGGTIEGYDTYFPVDYIDGDTLTREYNPTELIATENSIVELIEVVYEWALVKDQHGTIGWLPFSKLKSLIFA